jgi:pimeloyl-ACP methyl ester carboxylesterase
MFTSVLFSGVPITLGATTSTIECRANYIPVSLTKNSSKNQKVYAELCLPKGQKPSTVQVLLHGITYDHNYWDLPGFKNKYSYVDAATKKGYATLNVDRIGSGKSSHPLSARVDIFSDAWVAHQLVQALRKGSIDGPRGKIAFKHVIEVGHSYGSGITWIEASKYKDVDGVILTGALRDIRYDTLIKKITPSLYPAALDPKFGLLKQDVGYLTTRPGTRYKAFMAPGDVDPEVVKLDEKLKSTVTTTEMADIPLIINQKRDIRVPILLVMGENDTLFCDDGYDCSSAEVIIKRERSHFGSHVPSLDAYVLPKAGHDINFMKNAGDWFNYSLKWADKHIAKSK